MVAFATAALIFPDKGKFHLQYTRISTSPKLHKALGVPPAVFD